MSALSAAGWRAARRILCVRLDSLGDVLMCTPALRALRAHCDALPGGRLTLLASPSGAAAAPFIPDIDDVIVHRAPWMKDGVASFSAMSSATSSAISSAMSSANSSATSSATSFATSFATSSTTSSATSSAPAFVCAPATAGIAQPQRADLALVDTLAARAFDAAVIFTTYTQSALPAALLCHLAGIPLRLAHCRENPYRLLSDWVPDPEPGTVVRHEVQRQLELVRRIGCAPLDLGLSFVPRAADHAAAAAHLRGAGIDPDRPWVLLHPGASAASRRYPAGHWADVIRLLSAATALPLVLGGSAAEIALVDEIRRRSGVATHSLAGRLGLGELGAALQLAAVAVTNNSGPAHIAAAVGTPLVDLYALTNPQHTPWGTRSRVLFHDVPCRFCFKSVCPQGHQACLAEVAPQRVVDAVLDLLERPVPAAHPPVVDTAEQADTGDQALDDQAPG